MTREEAIKYFKRHLDLYCVDGISREAEEMAIQALSQEPTDAISRDELLKAIDTWDKFGYTETGCFVREPKGDYVPYIHYDDVIKSIKGMPSVTQKSGKWINNKDYMPTCSECGYIPQYDRAIDDYEYSNYCPSCGAKMESEDKE